MTILTVFLTLLLSSTSIQAAPQCPNAEEGEGAEDCPWAEIARAIAPEADQGKDAGKLLVARAPLLMKQVREDGKNPSLRALWGESINYDELAKGTIVHPAILGALSKAMGLPSPRSAQGVRGEVVHAGMEHLYGYLFSTLRTQFGYKRARWVRDDIEAGFGLPRGTLGPSPKTGSLFLNLTFFAGRIAFRKDSGSLSVVRRYGKEVPEELRKLDFEAFKVTRLEERVEAGGRAIVLRTDFVGFPHMKEGSKNAALLIYSVEDPRKSNPQLVTVFPVEASFVDRALSPEGLGDGKPVQTRYNAYVDGLTGAATPPTGVRKVIKP